MNQFPLPTEGWWRDVPLLNEFFTLLSDPSPVNWNFARQVGEALGAEGEPDADIDAATEQMRSLVSAATVEASAASGLTVGTYDVLCTDRTGWVSVGLRGLGQVLNPMTEQLTEGFSPAGLPIPASATEGIKRIAAILTGLQAGYTVGYLARSVAWGSEIVLPAQPNDAVCFVIPNLDAVARENGIEPQNLRFWAATDEVAHRIPLGPPWVRGWFSEQVRKIASSLEADPTKLSEAFGGFDPSDPEAASKALDDPQKLVRALWTPKATEAISKLQSFIALVEGYSAFITDSVAARLIPSENERLRQITDERRSAQTAGHALLEQMFGMEIGRQQFASGVAFCRYVAAVADLETLNRAFASESSLPTAAEIAAPQSWLDRI